VRLVPPAERPFSADEYGEKIAKIAKEWPEISKFFTSSNTFMNRIMRGGGANLLIEVYGYHLDTTMGIAKQISKIVEETPGSRGIRISQNVGRPELIIAVDRLRAASLGLNMNTVSKSLSTLFQGSEAARYREEDNEYAILLRLDAGQRTSIEDIKGSEISSPSGGRVRIDAFAEVREELGPVTLSRKNQERLITVEFDSIGRSQGEVMAEVQARIEKEVMLPFGVSLEYAGAIKDQKESERDMKLMIVLGILLVYMVMAAQFESFRHPFIIMFSLPFAFSGVAAALMITKTPISMIGYIGVILLIGVVVNNAIVLIDYINLLRERGEPLRDAIVNSGRQRLRPVLITTCTTLLGMLPMAVSTSDGSATWRPLGLVVVGGLSVSTLVTMLIVPVLYYFMEKQKSVRS
jgi:HAE1 family hydrophobic/amphiphilic exporter-1